MPIRSGVRVIVAGGHVVEAGEAARQLVTAQAVEGTESVLATIDEAGFDEHREMMGDEGRRQLERAADRAARELGLAVGEQIHDAVSIDVRQGG
ncbi:MAG: hypothetical protein ABIV28_00800 [Longimicrobiales bacterium]